MATTVPWLGAVLLLGLVCPSAGQTPTGHPVDAGACTLWQYETGG